MRTTIVSWFVIGCCIGVLPTDAWSSDSSKPVLLNVESDRKSSETEWINDNVHVVGRVMPGWEKNIWNTLVPLWGKGCDVKVEWSDPRDGARKLIEGCFPSTVAERLCLCDSLTDEFSRFQQLAQEVDPSASVFSVRLVATRGADGTKCPRWHYDHVPVRWIQALVGPGCEFVTTEKGVRRELLNQLETDADRNSEMVNPDIANIQRGLTGEAVVLRGLLSTDQPSVHKSPKLEPFMGRVLMTIDIAIQ